MENLSNLSEDITFDILKYKRYTLVGITIGNYWPIPAGSIYWVNDAGELHRKDGPAVIQKSGTAHWWENGKRHRENGPAVECLDGHKEWYQNGKRHRKDGPAVEYLDGHKEWWENGKLIKYV